MQDMNIVDNETSFIREFIKQSKENVFAKSGLASKMLYLYFIWNVSPLIMLCAYKMNC